MAKPDPRSDAKELLFPLFPIAQPQMAAAGARPEGGDGDYEVRVTLNLFDSKQLGYTLRQRGARSPKG
ncbi:MAG: hypothetical protein WCC48_04555 [Anaeromyxobacteraceae bacterium]